ncbi:hypothetical protein [Pedobacter sp. B4-66]|uniref:hypothetical protein n=1 Tax=Pedobacter sp. B4-66 TaxID=2817280 RepID=UPI001BD9192E|nr:hypothetical protein [Pedobacter sp. B4-66]
MKKLLMVVLACYGLTSRAQEHESRNFLRLYSDSVIYADRVRLRPNFSGTWQLQADSKRVRPELVKFFSNEDGFFANSGRLSFGRGTEFSERIVEGKINVYQEIPYDQFMYGREYRYRGRREPAVNLRMYYNKELDNLKKVSYSNLKNDMADNTQSMDFLQGYRRSMNTSKIMYAAAGASLVAGIFSFIVKGTSQKAKFEREGFGGQGFDMNAKGPNFTSTLVFLGLGLGFVAGGYSIQLSGSRHLENAVDAYNR